VQHERSFYRRLYRTERIGRTPETLHRLNKPFVRQQNWPRRDRTQARIAQCRRGGWQRATI